MALNGGYLQHKPFASVSFIMDGTDVWQYSCKTKFRTFTASVDKFEALKVDVDRLTPPPLSDAITSSEPSEQQATPQRFDGTFEESGAPNDVSAGNEHEFEAGPCLLNVEPRPTSALSVESGHSVHFSDYAKCAQNNPVLGPPIPFWRSGSSSKFVAIVDLGIYICKTQRDFEEKRFLQNLSLCHAFAERVTKRDKYGVLLTLQNTERFIFQFSEPNKRDQFSNAINVVASVYSSPFVDEEYQRVLLNPWAKISTLNSEDQLRALEYCVLDLTARLESLQAEFEATCRNSRRRKLVKKKINHFELQRTKYNAYIIALKYHVENEHEHI